MRCAICGSTPTEGTPEVKLYVTESVPPLCDGCRKRYFLTLAPTHERVRDVRSNLGLYPGEFLAHEIESAPPPAVRSEPVRAFTAGKFGCPREVKLEEGLSFDLSFGPPMFARDTPVKWKLPGAEVDLVVQKSSLREFGEESELNVTCAVKKITRK